MGGIAEIFMNIDISRLIRVSTYAKRAKNRNGSIGISRAIAYRRLKKEKVDVVIIDEVMFVDRDTP